MVDNVVDKNAHGESPAKEKPQRKRLSLSPILRGMFALLVCLAECAIVVYWVNGLVFCEGERMNILVSFRYIFRILEIHRGNVYPYLSGLLMAIVYLVQTVLLLKNIFMAFLCVKKVVGEMGTSNKVGSTDVISAFNMLQLSFYYAVLKIASFILVASLFVNCRLPQETIWVFASAVIIKLIFPFVQTPLSRRKIGGEILNLFGTSLLFFAWVFVALWSVRPWVQTIWNGAQALLAGALKIAEYRSAVPFLFSYFVQPIFMLILFVKIYRLLKALFNSLELGGNRAVFCHAKSLLILLLILAIVSWAVSEAANGFAGAGTENIFLRCYQATSDYHLLLLAAGACVTAYFFPEKGKKEKAII